MEANEPVRARPMMARAATRSRLRSDSGASVAFVDSRNLATAREAVEGISVQLVMVDASAAGLPQLSEIFAAGPAGFIISNVRYFLKFPL